MLTAMTRGYILLITTLITMELFSQSKSADREPVAAGRFYPGDKETLLREVSELFASCAKPSSDQKVRAIIVPHAGYVFSGKTAAAGFSATSKDGNYRNIFLIGSSHVMAFDGASVYNTGDFITPLGKAVVNRDIANSLKTGNRACNFPVTAHFQEHSLEVQIPLIQYYYSTQPKIVPIIIGTNFTPTIKLIAEALRPYFTPDNLFVFSSDFSHYPSYDDAKRVDEITATSLMAGNPEAFLATLKKTSSENIPGLVTSMCGWTSGLTLLYLAGGNKDLVFKKIDYTNSGDSPAGGKSEVVGYNAIILTEKNGQKKKEQEFSTDFTFTEEEKKMMFTIARDAIESKLKGRTPEIADNKKIPDDLKKNYGVFVTLKINGELRGCIGRFFSSEPLYDVIRQSAVSSAFEDPRFSPLTAGEYPKTDIEITVLGPMKKINDIKEIILGKHGIYIRKGQMAGTMLPQVAIENNWSVEEFLSYTSMYKAGIGKDGWKTADIFIYEGLVLEEKKK